RPGMDDVETSESSPRTAAIASTPAVLAPPGELASEQPSASTPSGAMATPCVLHHRRRDLNIARETNDPSFRDESIFTTRRESRSATTSRVPLRYTRAPWEPPCDAPQWYPAAHELLAVRRVFSSKGRLPGFEMKNGVQQVAVITLAAFSALSCAVSLDHEELDFDFAEARPRCVVAPPEGV